MGQLVAHVRRLALLWLPPGLSWGWRRPSWSPLWGVVLGLCRRGGAASESFVEPSRGSREASCIVVGPSWTVLGLSRAVLEPSVGGLGPSWSPSLGHLGAFWVCWGSLETVCGVVEAATLVFPGSTRNLEKSKENPRNLRSPGSPGSSFCLLPRPPGVSWGSEDSWRRGSRLRWTVPWLSRGVLHRCGSLLECLGAV